MRIWVDADACPGPIKEILFRAADRVPIEVVLVANKAIRTPRSPHIRSIRQGGTGTQSQDDRQPTALPERLEAGNLNVGGIAGLAAARSGAAGRDYPGLHPGAWGGGAV